MARRFILLAMCIAFQAHAQAQRSEERSVLLRGSAANQGFQLRPGGVSVDAESRLRDATLLRRPDLAEPRLRLQDAERLSTVLRKHATVQQVIPPGEKPGTQGDALDLIGRPEVPATILSAAVARLRANDQTTCTREIVRELDDAQRLVRNTSVDSVPIEADDRLFRFLHKLAGAENETATSRPALQRLEGAWRSVLANCFTAPETRPLFAQLSGRIGAFSVPGSAPFCSGTLLENGKILTARHCFIEEHTGQLIARNVKQLSFALADGSAVLDITPGFSPTDQKSYQLLGDWIVVAAPTLDKPLPKLPVAQELVAFPEAALARTHPTSLEVFAAVPLARTLDPVRFPSSIVGYHLPGCYVVFKQASCITHMCSVVPGGSGASLFTTSGDRPQWVGIHVGPETTVGGSCSNRSTSTNMALRGNAQIRTFFSE